jgi:hypothetical protein
VTRQFYLCRDRNEARRVRRFLAEDGHGFNVQAGTWPELVQAAAMAYLVAPPHSAWNERVTAALETCPDMFWSQSYQVAAEETGAQIMCELERLIRATTPAQLQKLCDSNTHPHSIDALSQRGTRHLHDLLQLFAAMEHELPADLEVVSRILNIPASEALRMFAVQVSPAATPLDPWAQALVDKLNQDSAAHAPTQNQTTQVFEHIAPAPSQSNSALAHLQQYLFDPDADVYAASEDETEKLTGIEWIGARDYLEETEVAVGMIQAQMEADPQLEYRDIAILLPKDPARSRALADLCAGAGIPLSGISLRSHVRDLGAEVVYHFVQIMRKPAPTMALAAFVTSPLLPWSRTEGFNLAATFMDGTYKLKEEWVSSKAGKQILKLINSGASETDELLAALDVLIDALKHQEFNSDSTLQEAATRALELCEEVREALKAGKGRGMDTIPWETLFRLATPRTHEQEQAAEINREGIAVFYEHEEPWRQVDTLYVLGFNAGHFPAQASPSAVFSYEDLEAFAAAGYALETPAEQGRRLRSLFKRQLGSATNSLHMLCSHYDPFGKEQGVSSSLSFMAQVFGCASEPHSLIYDLTNTADRDQITHLARSEVREATPPRPFEVKDLNLHINLLEVFKNSKGNIRPQSPSSLEVLMASPLAWLLQRADLEPRLWHADELDVLAKGTLAHAVFEKLFAPSREIPTDEEISAAVEPCLTSVMVETFPLLNRPEWKVERYHLVREIEQAALRWREILTDMGASVMGTEVWLSGTFNTHPIHGSADLILQLGDGRLYVVDYKKSSSKNRKERMEKGYDSQTFLYRTMLKTGSGEYVSSDQSKVAIDPHVETGGLYYLMNDQVALADTDGWCSVSNTITELGADVSVNAKTLIQTRLTEIGSGRIMLNSEGDEDWHEKNTGLKLYALDNTPLLRMFMHPKEEE